MKPKFTFTTTIATILLSIICINSNAQQAYIQFTYDAAGNRVVRQYFPAIKINDAREKNPEADKIAANYGIHVYPNPLMDGNSVTLVISSIKENEGEDAQVYVLDNTGKLLFTQKQSTVSPTQLDLSSYAAGIYYIKVAIGKEQLFYTITKAK